MPPVAFVNFQSMTGVGGGGDNPFGIHRELCILGSTNNAVLEEMKKAYMVEQGEKPISTMQWISGIVRLSVLVCMLFPFDI
jgi:hypothetical protein